MKKITTNLLALLVLLHLSTALFAQDASEGHFFTSFDSTKIYYEVRGNGYPVLLIHGFTGNGQGWKSGQLYGDLLKAGYKVILIDLRGNGQSGKPHADAGYANNAEARDIVGLMSSLGIKQYDAVGYSRGSIILSSLFVLDADRLHKAVMGGMGDGYTNPNWPRRIHAYEGLMGDTTHHDVDEMMKWINSQPFDKASLALQQKWQPSTSPQELAKVKIPVLIVRGTEDKDNGTEIGLQKLIPRSKLVYVPGDHGSASRTPEFSAVVLKFLGE